VIGEDGDNRAFLAANIDATVGCVGFSFFGLPPKKEEILGCFIAERR